MIETSELVIYRHETVNDKNVIFIFVVVFVIIIVVVVIIIIIIIMVASCRRRVVVASSKLNRQYLEGTTRLRCGVDDDHDTITTRPRIDHYATTMRQQRVTTMRRRRDTDHDATTMRRRRDHDTSKT